MRAIETTGILTAQGQLQLDHPLTQEKSSRVRVILLMSEEKPNEEDWLRAVASNPSFAFLNDSEEDIYTLADGSPMNYEG